MTPKPKTELMIKPISVMGMDLLSFKYKGVFGTLAEGPDWATLYDIVSTNRGKGEVQECILLLKERFKAKRFGGTVALNPVMKHIYQKLNITEYAHE